MNEQVVADFLAHYGVKGMKWGVRKPPPSKLDPSNARTKTTEKVIADYNSNMTNKQFFQKYATTRKTYAKRVGNTATPSPSELVKI